MNFVEYAMMSREVNLDKMKELAKDNPDDIGAKIMEYNVLHHYLGSSARCPYEGGQRDENFPAANIDLDVVKFLIDLAPDAANKADNGHYLTHPFGSGAYPLHLACFNADCPVSIIKFLIEKNPLALRQLWKKSYALPLHCYLARACIHPAWGYEDDERGYVQELPAFPSGALDYDVVKMLVDAYPEALARNISDDSGRSALHVLCEGCDVSMELMQLLHDKNGSALRVDGIKSPLWTLLYNSQVRPFPVDAFRYLFYKNPSDLKMESQKPSQGHAFDVGNETSLQVACSNPNMTVEIIEMLINLCPVMTKVEDGYNGCLPLHTLCQNTRLEEQAAIDILNILIRAYPKSLKRQTWDQNHCPAWFIIGGISNKLPITLAEENMSFGFCKSLLSQHTRLSRAKMVNILQMACVLNCSLDTIQKLVLEDRTLLREKDEDHCIALHTAAKHQSLEVVEFLVQEDENSLTIPDKKMEVALHKACRADNLDVVKYLVTKNDSALLMGNHRDELPVHLAAKYSSVGVLQILVEKNKYSLMSPNKSKEVALFNACRSGKLENVTYLATKNPSTLTMRNHRDKLPIHMAAEISSVAVVKFLVESNEHTLTMPDISKELALHKACRVGDLEVVKYIMNKCMGSVAIANHCNELPVHILCLVSDKSKDGKMVKHVETIFMMLRAYPEAIAAC